MAQVPQVETKVRLGLAHRMHMLASILRVGELFAQARMVLKAEHFSEPDEPHLRLVWKMALRLADEKGEHRFLESKERTWNFLHADCEAALAAHPNSLPAPFYDSLMGPAGFLAWAFSALKDGEVSPAWGRELLSRFLQERFVQDPFRDALDDAQNDFVANLPELIHKASERQAQVDALLAAGPAEVAPEGWEPGEVVRRKTGVVFLDKMLGGGHVDGQVYGILGAMKAGKTTIAIQLGVRVSEEEVSRVKEAFQANRAYQPGYAYLFHYEAGLEEVRGRAVGCAAQIHVDTIRDWKRASTTGHLHDYELAFWADSIKAAGLAEVPGERERFEKSKDITKYLRLMDMSGSDPLQSSRGSQGVQEIAAILMAEKAQGRRPACVIIDYATLCVDRFIRENGKRYEDRYPILNRFGHDCLRLIAAPFSCPVWIMNQLTGQANKKTAASKQSHTDASGTSTWGENLWANFQLGVRHDVYGVCRFFCGVSRQTKVHPDIVLDVDVAMGTATETTNYVVQENQIMPKMDANRLKSSLGQKQGSQSLPPVSTADAYSHPSD